MPKTLQKKQGDAAGTVRLMWSDPSYFKGFFKGHLRSDPKADIVQSFGWKSLAGLLDFEMSRVWSGVSNDAIQG